MSFTPFNAPLLSELLGDREIADQFSIKADISSMLAFEVALAKAQAESGLISAQAATVIETACNVFEPDLEELAKSTAKDGVVVPALINRLRQAIGDPHADDLHYGTTSQDVIDTSLMLRLKNVTSVYRQRLHDLVSALQELADRQGHLPAMARTRMQRALPVTTGHKITSWLDPLERLLANTPDRFPLQLGGPEGALSGMGDQPTEIAKLVAGSLGLSVRSHHWQTDRSPLMDYFSWTTKLTTALGKFGQDVCLLSQNEIQEIVLTGGGGSSAMAHKNNPVLAESLVSLAKFNAALNGALSHASLHEYERSGASWTLEWMLVPQMCVATAASLRNARSLTDQMMFREAAN